MEGEMISWIIFPYCLEVFPYVLQQYREPHPLQNFCEIKVCILTTRHVIPLLQNSFPRSLIPVLNLISSSIFSPPELFDRMSFVCPFVNFLHCHLLLKKHWVNFNQTWHITFLGEEKFKRFLSNEGHVLVLANHFTVKGKFK